MPFIGHPKMSSVFGDAQLLTQTIIYFCIVLFGFLIAVPLGITTTNFRGYCIMYAAVTSQKIEFGPSSNCYYVTYLHVMTSVLYAFVMALLHTITMVKRARGDDFGLVQAYSANLAILGVNAGVTFLSLIAACIISVGFSRWCDSLIVNAHLHHGYQFQSCADAQKARWEGVDGSSFHSCYSLATAACWLVLFSWLVQTGLNVLTFIRQRRGDDGSSSSGSPSHIPTTPGSPSSAATVSIQERY